MTFYQKETMTKRFLLFLVLLFLLPSLGFTQTTDTKLWTGFAIEKKINKKFKASIDFVQRLENNISSFDRFLVEPSISYSLNKKWSISLIYRYWYQQEEQNYFSHQRASLAIGFSKKIKGIDLKLTSKMQYGFPDANEDDFFMSKKLVSRNSIKLAYEIFGTRFTPYFKYELFTALERFSPLNYQWRLQGGTDIYITSAIDLRLYYFFENEYNTVGPTDSSILGISLKYSL